MKVNSLFTIAVFVGLSLADRGQRGLENRAECSADIAMRKRLVVTEVVSFGFYLLSSLTAKALKIHVSTYRDKFQAKKISYQVIRGSLLVLALWSSVLGCIFLTISMVDVIQIKVGKVSCGSGYSVHSVQSLVAIVSIALVIFFFFTMHSIYYISTVSFD